MPCSNSTENTEMEPLGISKLYIHVYNEKMGFCQVFININVASFSCTGTIYGTVEEKLGQLNIKKMPDQSQALILAPI